MTSQIAIKIIEAVPQARKPADEMESLSPREQEVIELLARGFLYKEIADLLQVSYRTVSTHTEHIYKKLHVHSRAQAVAKYCGQT